MKKIKIHHVYMFFLILSFLTLGVVLLRDGSFTEDEQKKAMLANTFYSTSDTDSSTFSRDTESSSISETNSSSDDSSDLSSPSSSFSTESSSSTYSSSSSDTSIIESSSKIQELGSTVEMRTEAVDSSKEQLMEIINESVTDIIIESRENPEQNIEATDVGLQIDTLRYELIKNVDFSLPAPSTVTTRDVENLKTEIDKGILEINKTIEDNKIGGETVERLTNRSMEDVAATLNLLSEAISNQTESLREQETDLLFKDSNGDGVSDYDSIYVYDMDPFLPSPVSLYEGKNLNAAEKILLGFDPKQIDVKKIEKEEPIQSQALVVVSYKVKEVALSDKKEVVFKGQALPNSFITLYIYSTPIIVTVKTDERGEWQYVLDKELENGNHTVYTATVNNSGNIIAKSSPFIFTKTAEAASLQGVPFTGLSAGVEKPGLFKGTTSFIILGIVGSVILVILILAGMTNKRPKNETLE